LAWAFGDAYDGAGMSSLNGFRQRRWGKLLAVVLALTLVAGCQEGVAQVGIPIAYGATGLCLALLVSPTATAAVVGFVVGCVLGAAVYNNSLKR
jgi:hypothetical protein